MQISIVLPVHNEVNTIEKVIKAWTYYLSKLIKIKYEFVICEDGSSDGTKELILELQKKYPVNNQSVQSRRGYGQAMIDGIKNSNGIYILCIDSDGQCLPENFINFWKLRDTSDFMMGWRYPRRDPIIRRAYSSIFFIYHKILFRHNLHDPSWAYVFGKKKNFLPLLKYLIYMREGFWWGFVGACVKNNKSIKEIKCIHAERNDGDTRVYRLNQMPVIIFRNIIGLLRLRFAK